MLTLRAVTDDDLPIFFEQQLDPQANWMAAFTSKDPNDRAAFFAKWSRIRADENTLIRTIIYEGQVAGSVLSYVSEGEPEVSYWLGREFWGKGIATQALAAFLQIQTARPIYARVARDNLASLRVLRRCGFEITGEDKGFANGRGEEVEEYALTLSSPDQTTSP
jgi:RimJ/RimL family protein N-acetyltransferase